MEYDSQLEEELKEKVNPHLYLGTYIDSGKQFPAIKFKCIGNSRVIYDLANDQWINTNYVKPIIQGIEIALQHQKERNESPLDYGNHDTYSNHFQEYTDHLAEVLQEKNNAYSDSFGKSLDEDGLLVLKIHLGDKFNRISSLIKKGELKENDESLEDTLLDLAGYSILGLKYLKEHEDD